MSLILLGVFFHLLGGASSGSFYIPYKGVRGWAWESYWITGGVFSWVVMPLLAVWLTVPGFWEILREADLGVLLRTYMFGVLWGVGGLTFGLSMRYLGLSLGISVVLGLTSALGALIPPLYADVFGGDATLSAMLHERGGQWVLSGVAIQLLGIAICGRAGQIKEREVPAQTAQASVQEFALGKGLLVALVSGVLSACFNFGIAAGRPMAQAAVEHGAHTLFQSNAIFVVIMWGGLTTNLLWCMWLNTRHRSFGNYVDRRTPLLRNYVLSACAGSLWFLQFFFYGMGESRMQNDASSWVLHMSCIIVISNLWGLYFREWRGASRRNLAVLGAGIVVILAAIAMVGMGNYLQYTAAHAAS